VIKVFSISLMLLFFCSNLNANTNIEKALENCADDYYVNKRKLNEFTPMLFLLNPKYQELEKESKSLKEKLKSVSGQFDMEYKKWEKDNPKPRMGIDGESDFEKYKKKRDQWFKKSNKAFFAILDSVDGGATKRLEIVQMKMERLIRSQAAKFIGSEDFNLKSKVKEVEGYLEIYTACEKAYQETPSSFKLLWSD